MPEFPCGKDSSYTENRELEEVYQSAAEDMKKRPYRSCDDDYYNGDL